MQLHKCLTSACKCAASLTIDIFMHTSVNALGSMNVYMHTWGACKRAVNWVSDVCMCMCREPYPCTFYAHFCHTAHSPFTWTHWTVGSVHVYITHQVYVDVQWHKCLAGSQTNGSVHIFMHTSAIRLTPQLREHIRESNYCTFTCTHQGHVNVQWPVCLTCVCKCAECKTIGSLHIFMQISVIVLTAQLLNTSDGRTTARLYAHVKCL